MYSYINKDGTLAGTGDNFSDAMAWANGAGGQSVFHPNQNRIIYTNTAGGTVNPDFNVSTFRQSPFGFTFQPVEATPPPPAVRQPLPAGDSTTSAVSTVPPAEVVVASAVEDTGPKVGDTKFYAGQALEWDGFAWMPVPTDNTGAGGAKVEEGEFRIGTTASVGGVPSIWQGEALGWVPVTRTYSDPGGSAGGTGSDPGGVAGGGPYAGIDFKDPDFMKDWGRQLSKGNLDDFTTGYVDGLLQQWALANGQNPSSAYGALFEQTGDSIFDDAKFGQWASGARNNAIGKLNLEDSQLIESSSRDGRRALFDRYRATQGLGGKTARALELFNAKFDPASAKFSLDNVLDERFTGEKVDEFKLPESREDTNFRSFLDAKSPFGSKFNISNPLDKAGFDDRFARIQKLFKRPEEEMDVTDLARKRALSGPNADQAMVFNIMKQALGANVNPFLRGNVGDILSERVSAFRDANTETDLFQEFVNRGFKF
jgi:hypothetical protein